jgi:hypothetical protein
LTSRDTVSGTVFLAMSRFTDRERHGRVSWSLSSPICANGSSLSLTCPDDVFCAKSGRWAIPVWPAAPHLVKPYVWLKHDTIGHSRYSLKPGRNGKSIGSWGNSRQQKLLPMSLCDACL